MLLLLQKYCDKKKKIIIVWKLETGYRFANCTVNKNSLPFIFLNFCNNQIDRLFILFIFPNYIYRKGGDIRLFITQVPKDL